MTNQKDTNCSVLDKVVDFGKQLFAAILRSRKGALSELCRLLRFQQGTKGFERMFNKLLPLREELKAAFQEKVKEQFPDDGLRLGILDDSSIKKAGKKFPKQKIHHDHTTNAYYSGMKVLSSIIHQKGKVAAVGSQLVGKEDNKLDVAQQEANKLITEYLVDILLFDSWYCKNPLLEHLLKRNALFISRVRRDSKVFVKDREIQLHAYAQQFSHAAYTQIVIHGKSYWAKDLLLDFKAYGKLRVIVSKDSQYGEPIFLVTNAENFSPQFIVKLYLKRFAIEVFFKDAKQFLNLETFFCRRAEKWEMHLLLTNILHWAIQRKNSISKTIRAIREDIDACVLFINQNASLQAFFALLRERVLD